MLSILSTSPVAGAISVPLNQVVAIEFNQPMDPDSINVYSIILAVLDTPVDAEVTYNEPSHIAYLTPNTFLLPSTQYKLYIIGDVGGIGAGVCGISDTLPDTAEIDFTTAPDLPEVSGLYVQSIEYWIDITGSYGTGTSAYPTDGVFDSDWEPFYATIDIVGQSLGAHEIYVHSCDSEGGWGAMQDIPFMVTSGSYQSSYTQTEYHANYMGPYVFSLSVTPTPTAAAPLLYLYGISTTRTSYWEPPTPTTNRVGNLSILSCVPENNDSSVPMDVHIKLIFNDIL